MRPLASLLDPRSIAIVGLSSDTRKRGSRVLKNLRNLGFRGEIHGINPNLPPIEGVDVYAAVGDIPDPPDLVVVAVPSEAAVDVVGGLRGVGAVIVFASGFGERDATGDGLERLIAQGSIDAGARLLGPNSGGVIRASRGLAASFLTCLDRASDQIRSGPVGVVTQSGGIGSYIHNLAAGRGDGLAVSVSTGNETDIKLGEAIEAVSRLEEVRAIVTVFETIRDGEAFVGAIRSAESRGMSVIACPLGSGPRSSELLASHTGAMAVPRAVVRGVLDSLGVVVAETPAEAFDIASAVARSPRPAGPRVGVVTHSGGAAILLSDLGHASGLAMERPSPDLVEQISTTLDHGAGTNPLDLGGIIDGPGRFPAAVEGFGNSGEYDVVLAVSTPHPPDHTLARVTSLLALESETPIVHLWMAGDQATTGLDRLRLAEAAVTEEPRAAIKALASLTRRADETTPPAPLRGPPESWGIPLETGTLASTPPDAVAAAETMGYPVTVKAEAPGLAHRSDIGAVRLDLRGPAEVEAAHIEVAALASEAGWGPATARVQRHRPGLEVIVGGLKDAHLGPLVLVGWGGTLTEVTGDAVFSPAPVGQDAARKMIARLRSRELFHGVRGSTAADLEFLAYVISQISRGIAGSEEISQFEINPLIWDGAEWVGVDWLTIAIGDV